MESSDTGSMALVGQLQDGGGISSSILIAETYHSTIETWPWKDTKAVIKRVRKRDTRTISNWHKEVEILKLVARHVSRTR